jgi:hypothetical protein
MSSSEISLTPVAANARRLDVQAGGLSIAAGVIHAVMSPSHMEAWWGYGLFFMLASAFQILYGIVLLGGVFDASTYRGDAVKAKRNFLTFGVLANVGIIVMYLVSRTMGIPFFGPEAGTVEAFGVIDIVSKLIEIALVVWLVRLMRPHVAPWRAA